MALDQLGIISVVLVKFKLSHIFVLANYGAKNNNILFQDLLSITATLKNFFFAIFIAKKLLCN